MPYRKIEYAKDLARRINDGSFAIERLASMEDQQSISTITRLHGFGRWSAEIQLMFCLGRTDILPADDLACWLPWAD